MNSLHRDLELLIKEKEAVACKQDQKWKLHYHLMPPTGWLNDPNGLCYFQGEYHFFFQYSPFDAKGSLKFWGHSKSKDLIHWEYVGVALMPDQPFDCHGVYSGSACIDGNEMLIYYTGNVKYSGNYNYITNGRGSNTILVHCKDGIHLENKECLLTTEDYPDNLTCHVRDPKVWKEGKFFYMVLGGRNKEDKGVVLLYSSSDGKNWEFIQFLTTPEPFGYMWECPDLFSLGEQKILSVSPQGLTPSGFDYQNVYQSGYFLFHGDFCHKYTLECFQEWDRGFDFYAPQTLEDPQGRRILVGWMGMPDSESFYQNPTVELGWQHAFTLPRELIYHEGKVLQRPIKELKKLRGEKTEGQTNFSCHSCFELLIEPGYESDCKIIMEQGVFLEYTQEKHLFTLYFAGNIGAGRTSRSVHLHKLKNIHLFADTSSLEIFLNDGEEVFSTRYYPENEEVTTEIQCPKAKITLWKLVK